MATKATLELEKLDNATPNTDEVFTLDQVRSKNRINIVLPYVAEGEDSDHLEEYEYVHLNGKTIQIKKGEVIPVSWEIYEILKHSDSYKNLKILA